MHQATGNCHSSTDCTQKTPLPTSTHDGCQGACWPITPICERAVCTLPVLRHEPFGACRCLDCELSCCQLQHQTTAASKLAVNSTLTQSPTASAHCTCSALQTATSHEQGPFMGQHSSKGASSPSDRTSLSNANLNNRILLWPALGEQGRQAHCHNSGC
jgi:hypothetical protein